MVPFVLALHTQLRRISGSAREGLPFVAEGKVFPCLQVVEGQWRLDAPTFRERQRPGSVEWGSGDDGRRRERTQFAVVTEDDKDHLALLQAEADIGVGSVGVSFGRLRTTRSWDSRSLRHLSDGN